MLSVIMLVKSCHLHVIVLLLALLGHSVDATCIRPLQSVLYSQVQVHVATFLLSDHNLVDRRQANGYKVNCVKKN